MTATIHNLKINQRHPAALKQQGLFAHTCGSTHFQMTVPGNIYCAKCGELVPEVQFVDREDRGGEAA